MSNRVVDGLDPLLRALQARDSECAQEAASALVAGRLGPGWALTTPVQKLGDGQRVQLTEVLDALLADLHTSRYAPDAVEGGILLQRVRATGEYAHLARVADALLRSASPPGDALSKYAQALIEMGQVHAAIPLLERGREQATPGSDEYSECWGLLGRCYKQLYVDAGSSAEAQWLEKSLDCYRHVFDHPEHREHATRVWHGCNLAAIAVRARRDGVELPGAPDPAETANELLAIVERERRKSPKDPWLYATAIEANVVLKRFPEATRCAAELSRMVDLESDESDSFPLASALAQLQRVWELHAGNPEHAPLIQTLESAYLRSRGGQTLMPVDAQSIAGAEARAQDKEFEAVLGADRYKTFQWYAQGLGRARSVAKIKRLDGMGHGTGFLVRGADLYEGWGDEPVLVTNAHVVSTLPEELRISSLAPEEATVVFEAQDHFTTQATEELFSSGRWDLDCTILRLQALPAKAECVPLASRDPVLSEDPHTPKPRAYVVGHPRGAGLALSLHDSRLLEMKSPLVRYRSPTESGSSGSPVFNDNWMAFALHHAGGRDMKKLEGKGWHDANEGIHLMAIKAAIAEAEEKKAGDTGAGSA